MDEEPRSKSSKKLRPRTPSTLPLSIQVLVSPQHAIMELTRRLPKGNGTKRGREVIIGNKVRNGMVSTSTCTPAKGNGKVKIIGRGMKSNGWGWRAHTRGGGQQICIRSRGNRWNSGDMRRRRGKRRGTRGNQREGIKKDLEGREARQRRCSNRSWRKQGKGEEGRVLIEGDIGRIHIMIGVRKVYSVAFLCPRVAKKYAFESARGELGQGRRVIMDKGHTSKDP